MLRRTNGMSIKSRNLEDHISHILITSEELDKITDSIARQIERDYAAEDSNILLLCILKGAVVFMGDLMKKLKLPVQIDFMKVSSYGAATKSSGNINILLDFACPNMDKVDIIIIEDIIDSGKTLSFLVKYLRQKGAKSVKTCTLLDKPSRREVDFTPDYVGKIIPDEFVVGYGLDYAEQYRTLPFIGVLKEDVYKS